MIAVVPPSQADAALAHLHRLRTPAYLVGQVRETGRGKRGGAVLL
jgi:hydrogenase maturation factor